MENTAVKKGDKVEYIRIGMRHPDETEPYCWAFPSTLILVRT